MGEWQIVFIAVSGTLNVVLLIQSVSKAKQANTVAQHTTDIAVLKEQAGKTDLRLSEMDKKLDRILQNGSRT
jgi:hypothetical protein